MSRDNRVGMFPSRPAGYQAVERNNLALKIALLLVVLSFVVIEMDLGRVLGRRIALPLFAVLAAVSLIIPGQKWSQRRIRHGLPPLTVGAWCALSFWALISSVWSVDPIETFLHSSVLWLVLVLALLYSKYDPVMGNYHVYSILLAVTIASLGLVLILPQYALDYGGVVTRLKGVMQHEFRLGYLVAVGFIASALSLFSAKAGADLGIRPRFRLFGTIVFGAALAATQTRSLLAYSVLLAAINISRYGRGYRRVLIVTLGIFAVVLMGIYSSEIASLFSRGSQDASLTGRTTVWERTIDATARNNIWLGAGYATYLDPQFDSEFGNYRPPHAHNTVLHAFFEVGIIGALLCIILMFSMLYEARVVRLITGRVTLVGIIISLSVLAGLTGVVFGGKVSPLVAIALLLMLQEYKAAAVALGKKAKNNG